MAEPHRETSGRDGEDDDRVRDLSRITESISTSKHNNELPVGILDTYQKRAAVSPSYDEMRKYKAWLRKR